MMNDYRIFYTLIFLMLLTACDRIPNKKTGSSKPLTILVQSFKDIDSNDVDYVVASLKKMYPYLQVRKFISLPAAAWNPLRGRYRADSLIRFLSNRANENEVMIGLTSMDISTTNNSRADWGVMGLGYCPGRACVVSTFRLSPQYRQLQLFKVSIHELGHTQGLQHCKMKTCLMRDAEGNNPVNEEKEFCIKCRPELIKKGWQFDKAVMSKL
jgi:archaemetzincin